MSDVRGDKSTIVRSVFRLHRPAETPVARSFETAAPGYPWELIGSLQLADGVTLRLRPIHPDDEPSLVELFNRLSPRTVYQRFFRAYDRLPEHWYRHFANVDYRTRLALVAEEHGADASLRAVARYEPGETPGTIEVAIVVEDGWQRRGLGALLLDALLAAAEARGLRRFTADVLADNRPMLRVLSRLADVRRRELDGGVLTIEFERRQIRNDQLASLFANPRKGGPPMPKIIAGTTVALASVGLLLLGGCTTPGVRGIGTNSDNAGASSASPSTSSETEPKFDTHFDLNEIPQAL